MKFLHTLNKYIQSTMTNLSVEQISTILGSLGVVITALTKYYLDNKKKSKKSEISTEDRELIEKLKKEFEDLQKELNEYKNEKLESDHEDSLESVKDKFTFDKRLSIVEERVKNIKEDVIEVKELLSNYKESSNDEMRTIYKKLDEITIILLKKIE